MKKTIASIAICVSATTASAIIGPIGPGNGGFNSPRPELPKAQKVCVSVYKTNTDGSKEAGSCDQTEANQIRSKKLLLNGCAEGQVAMVLSRGLQMHSCPTAVQL